MRTFSRGVALIFLFALVFFSSILLAQSSGNSGTVSGTVTDPTGAVVPGATVSIHNPVSEYERTVMTDKTGHFQFPNVPLNPYHLTVSISGFNGASQDVDVVSVVPITANITLQVGPSQIILTPAGIIINAPTIAMTAQAAMALTAGGPLVAHGLPTLVG